MKEPFTNLIILKDATMKKILLAIFLVPCGIAPNYSHLKCHPMHLKKRNIGDYLLYYFDPVI
jgi:hypothetical protein